MAGIMSRHKILSCLHRVYLLSWFLFLLSLLLGLRFRAELIKEVCSTFSRQLIQVIGKWVLKNRGWGVKTASLCLIFRVFLDLLSKVPFSLKSHFFSIEAEFFEQVIRAACRDTLQSNHFQLFSRRDCFTRHLIIQISHGALLHRFGHFLVEFIDFLGDLLLLRCSHLSHNLEAFTLECHQFAAKTEASTAFWQKPFGCVSGICLLALNWLSEFFWLLFLVCFSDRLGACRLEWKDIGVAVFIKSCNLAVQVLRPDNRVVGRLCVGELQDHLSCLEVSHNGALISSCRNHEIGVSQTPGNGCNSTVMNILESGYRVVSFTQIPNIEARVLIVIVGDHKLGCQVRVPHHASPFGLHLIFILVLVVKVIRRLRRLRLCELEDWLGGLEVPDNDFAILTCAWKDVGHNSVPADCSDVTTFVEVWLSGLKLRGLL